MCRWATFLASSHPASYASIWLSSTTDPAIADSQDGAVTDEHFRRVMASFVTGVTVVTTQVRGEVRGMTANAFMSGSLDPPLCVISVGMKARMHAFLLEAGHFGVNILARGQEPLINHFAGRPSENVDVKYEYAGDTPLFAEANATIAATVDRTASVRRPFTVCRPYLRAPTQPTASRRSFCTSAGSHRSCTRISKQSGRPWISGDAQHDLLREKAARIQHFGEPLCPAKTNILRSILPIKSLISWCYQEDFPHFRGIFATIAT